MSPNNTLHLFHRPVEIIVDHDVIVPAHFGVLTLGVGDALVDFRLGIAAAVHEPRAQILKRIGFEENEWPKSSPNHGNNFPDPMHY